MGCLAMDGTPLASRPRGERDSYISETIGSLVLEDCARVVSRRVTYQAREKSESPQDHASVLPSYRKSIHRLYDIAGNFILFWLFQLEIE